MKNRILKLQILALVLFGFYSCADDIPKQRIPWARVHFFIELNAKDSKLKDSGGYDESYSGGTSGIVIVNTPLFSDESVFPYGYLYAYDKCCPYEGVPAIKVDVINNGQEAVCPSCKTRYSLWNAGNPLEGVGKYPLQNYRITASNQNSLIYLVENVR